MISIRLLLPLRYDHFEVPAGTVLKFEQVPASTPQELTQQAIARGIAERAEPEHAVLESQERRTRRPK